MDGVSIPARCDFLAAKFVRKTGLVSRINLHSTFSLSGRFLNVPIRRTSGRYVVWDDGTGGIGFFMLCVFIPTWWYNPFNKLDKESNKGIRYGVYLGFYYHHLETRAIGTAWVTIKHRDLDDMLSPSSTCHSDDDDFEERMSPAGCGSKPEGTVIYEALSEQDGEMLQPNTMDASVNASEIV